MKKTWRVILAALMIAAVLFAPATSSASQASELPRITVMLKSGGTLKNRVITSGARMQIVSRADGRVLDSRMLSYTTTDDEIVSADRYGVITTGEPGTAEITVSSRDGSRTAVIRVTVRKHILSSSTKNRDDDVSEPDEKASVWSKTGGSNFF